MSDDELRDFVRDALSRGVPRPAILEALLQAGWPAEEAEAALGRWAEIDFPIPVPRRRPYLSAREAFLYLVMFACLYVTAFHVGAIVFAIVDWWWPNPAHPYPAREAAAGMVRNAVASLVIAFPVFLLLARHIGGVVRREPEKRGSKVRKWLTYLTLFLAALVIIGDLIVLVARVLAGELATPFLLKVLTVFAIAGTVFGHYLADLRRDENESRAVAAAPRGASPLARAAAAAVIAVLLGGLWFIGSPQRERARQIDERRVRELQALADAMDTFWRERRRLPLSLDELADLRFTASFPRVDPVTGIPYEFQPVDSIQYVLCATFDAPDTSVATSPARAPDFGGDASRFWRHAAGRTCFELEVSRAARLGP